MKLSGNKILITGGNKGIGLAMAKKFMALGNKVIINGRNIYSLHILAEEYPNLEVFQCDLTNSGDIDSMVDFIKEKHSDLNVLINNAGVQFQYDLGVKQPVMHWVHEELDTNLLAPIHLVTSLLPILERNANSAVVNVSSALAFVPKQSAPIYSASKAALHNFTQVLRYQLERKVKVFEVIPALVDTDMTEGRGTGKISPEQLVEEFVRGFEKDRYEINIGKVKLLRTLHRAFPRVADRMMRFK